MSARIVSMHKWVHLLVLTALLATSMPFAVHAQMRHTTATGTILADSMQTVPDYLHHHSPDVPQQPADRYDCDCLTASCYSPAISSTAYNLPAVHKITYLLSGKDDHAQSGQINRLERPPRS